MRFHRPIIRTSIAIILPAFALAQLSKPDTCRIVWNTGNPENSPTATLHWNDKPPNVAKVSFQAGETKLDAAAPVVIGGNMLVDLKPEPAPVGSKEATVTLTDADDDPVQFTCPIYSPAQWKTAAFEQFQAAATAAKGGQQQNIFAAFNVAAPSGGGAQGNAEVHLNGGISGSSQNLHVSLNLRQSSTANADPKQFDAGIGWEWQHLFIKREYNNLLKAGSSANPADLSAATAALRRKFWLAAGIDGAGRIEGEAMNFNVTNAVADIPFQIASRTKQVGSNGWFFLRLIPAGIEAGKNLKSEDETNPKYTIARYKAGGTLGLFWRPTDPRSAPFKKVMLECNAVDRYLFLSEAAYDATAKKAVSIASGNQYYVQADLKFYLAETAQGSYGFRVSLVRGALPPVFSYTHTFLYGFVFESKDKGQ
jgi:hypothetical protein